MRILAWLTSFLKKTGKTSAMFTPRTSSPAAVGANERVFCFANGRKTAFLAPGMAPQAAQPGEKYAILPVGPVAVAVERNGQRFSLDIVGEADDALATTLEQYPDFDEERLTTLCDNALAAALTAMGGEASPERLRAFVSVELLLSGFRCAGLSSVPLSVSATERPEAGPPEPEGSTAELAAELRAVSELATQHGLPVPTAMLAGDTLADREKIMARLKATATDLAAELRVFRDSLVDSRSIEARLSLAESAGKKSVTVEVADPKRPFTALVWRRSDIDAKLRPYVETVLLEAAKSARLYRREALGRNVRLGGRVDALASSLDSCRAEAASLPVLRHGFSYTKPEGPAKNRQGAYIREVADAVAGVRGAVALLCSQPAEERAIAAALTDAETAVAALAATIHAHPPR